MRDLEHGFIAFASQTDNARIKRSTKYWHNTSFENKTIAHDEL